jgi:hypothetical protein
MISGKRALVQPLPLGHGALHWQSCSVLCCVHSESFAILLSSVRGSPEDSVKIHAFRTNYELLTDMVAQSVIAAEEAGKVLKWMQAAQDRASFCVLRTSLLVC